MNNKHLLPLFTAFLCWGSTYIVFKIALETVPPVTLLLCRYLVAVPTLLIVLKLRGALKPMKRESVGVILTIGFVGYFASFCIQMLGINRLSSSVSSLLGAMHPIFIPLLATVFLKEKLSMGRILSIAVSMAGVAVIVGVSGTADLLGVLMMLLSVFLWSGASIIIRRISGQYDPMQIAMMAIFCAIPFVGAWSVLELQTNTVSFPMASVLSILYMGTIGMAVPHSLWNYCLSKMDASICSMFYPMQPLVSATLGVLILGESITVNYVAGSVIICCGIVGAVYTGMRKK